MQHESMNYDVVIVGAGPAGLSAAIKLKQLANEHNQPLNICIIEKGKNIGAHTLSGAVLEPSALNALLPNWKHDNSCPVKLKAQKESFYLLRSNRAIPLPLPKLMKNDGNFIISIGQLCQYLANQAESLGVEIYPGFAASKVLYNELGEVIGIATNDMGVGKNGEKKASYMPGMHLLARQTLLAEGARGYLSEKLMKRFNLRDKCSPQSYGIGLKEIWKVKKSEPGKIIHTIGWPLDKKTYGGSFIYHLENNHISIGLVVGLDYANPYLDPFKEFQKLKTHPKIKPLLIDGERLSFGARALNEGGLQAIPKLTFPGGLLIGDAAGFLNVGKIKGIHNAMHSGMLAAESVFKELNEQKEIHSYSKKIKNSSIYKELYQVRNLRPSFHYGLYQGLLLSAIDQYLLRGHAPWTMHYQSDNQQTQKAQNFNPITYPKPDNKITFDKSSSLYLSGTFHEEDQPCHLKLKKPNIAIDINYRDYASPETRYCPAGVYELVEKNNELSLQINAQNCLHCKTCDIKDITQNIVWTPPEGSGGPNYKDM